MQNTKFYETELTIDSDYQIEYLFESTGEKTISKAIRYSPIERMDETIIYNLGFGDFDKENQEIYDNTNSNNGDMHIVFNTVLSTIPLFFNSKPDCAIFVGGSDSTDTFREECKKSCKKKCGDNSCKNENRRIRTYRYFIDKNFTELSQEYIFFGRTNIGGIDKYVKYVPGVDYQYVLVYKKK